jgi:hypothetical protein
MALPGKGATLWVGATPAKVLGLDGASAGASTTTIATTSMGDDWESFIAGLKKGDEFTVSGRYEPTDTTGQIAMRVAWLAGTALACEVRYGGTTKVAFSSIVTGFSTASTTVGAVTVSIKVQPSGALTFTD